MKAIRKGETIAPFEDIVGTLLPKVRPPYVSPVERQRRYIAYLRRKERKENTDLKNINRS